MADNMLTTKELTLLTDLLNQQEIVTKKARLYSRILTNVKLCECFKSLADNHEERFNALLELL